MDAPLQVVHPRSMEVMAPRIVNRLRTLKLQ